MNEGSCFCIYNAFNPDLTQLVNFRASTACIVYTISLTDLRALEQNFMQLSDIFKQMEVEMLQGEKTDLDFFRFLPPRKKPLSDLIRRMIRRKFRATVISFVKKRRSGDLDQLPALDAIKAFIDQRNARKKQLDDLGTKVD